MNQSWFTISPINILVNKNQDEKFKNSFPLLVNFIHLNIFICKQETCSGRSER